MLRSLLASLFLVLAGAAQSAEHFDGKTWWHTVTVLADDRFEGRDTGTSGERAAQAYIVQQLQELGVEPAGSDGYFQPVHLKALENEEKSSSLALVRDGHERPLTLGEQAFFATRYGLAPRVQAPLVFVGYGLDVPETGYNDLAGLDLTGKIAVDRAAPCCWIWRAPSRLIPDSSVPCCSYGSLGRRRACWEASFSPPTPPCRRPP